MKRTFFILAIFLVFTQCTENENENVVLPTTVWLNASKVSDNGSYYQIELTGQYVDGTDQVKQITMATGGSVFSVQPSMLSYHMDVEKLESNKFKVLVDIAENSGTQIAFYFISSNSAAFSNAYYLRVLNGQVSLTQINPR